MKKLGRKWAFKPSMVADAPDTAGIYALWDGDTLLLVGQAKGGDDTLRARLAAHLERSEGRSGAPTHYSWQICTNPRERAAEVLAEIRRASVPAVQPAGEPASG
jgi:hypothetical protein